MWCALLIFLFGCGSDPYAQMKYSENEHSKIGLPECLFFTGYEDQVFQIQTDFETGASVLELPQKKDSQEREMGIYKDAAIVVLFDDQHSLFHLFYDDRYAVLDTSLFHSSYTKQIFERRLVLETADAWQERLPYIKNGKVSPCSDEYRFSFAKWQHDNTSITDKVRGVVKSTCIKKGEWKWWHPYKLHAFIGILLLLIFHFHSSAAEKERREKREKNEKKREEADKIRRENQRAQREIDLRESRALQRKNQETARKRRESLIKKSRDQGVDICLKCERINPVRCPRRYECVECGSIDSVQNIEELSNYASRQCHWCDLHDD